MEKTGYNVIKKKKKDDITVNQSGDSRKLLKPSYV